MAANTFRIERSVSIDAPPMTIYSQIANFRSWTSWSPWEETDPQLRRTYSGADSGTGAVYGWSGNRKAGQGRMEITDAIEPEMVQIDLVFEKPWKAHHDTLFTIAAECSGSRVTWSITGRNTLMTRAMGIFRSMDQLLGPDFEKGLARLKATTEKAADNGS